MKIKQTAGRNQLGDFAPEFAWINDDVFYFDGDFVIHDKTRLLKIDDKKFIELLEKYVQ